MGTNATDTHPGRLVAGIALLAGLAVVYALSLRLPVSLWWHATRHPDPDDIRQVLIAFSYLPRLATSILSGALLGLAGTLFQQVTRNPVADPTTLGVSAGASLALSIALVFAPELFILGRTFVALAGAGVAAAIVFCISARRGMSPITLILAGMLVSLYCGALAIAVQLIGNPNMISVFLWGAGSLAMQDWRTAMLLFLCCVASVLALPFLLRPLAVLNLDDEGARGLGIPLAAVRLAGLGMATAMSAIVVSAVGIIGFVGLAAPVLVRVGGARRLGAQLIWAPLFGAALLCLTDQLVQLASGSGRELIPTGAATALIGVPILLWMLPRLANGRGALARPSDIGYRARHPSLVILAVLVGLGLVTIISLHLGQDGHGWYWGSFRDLMPLLQWRVPRLAGSLAAGAMLAVAGCLMQRLTGNPMAAPDILGISGGAGVGFLLSLFVAPAANSAFPLIGSTLGALATLTVMMAFTRRSQFVPDRILLAGISVNACFGVVMVILLATGGPYVARMQSWMAGATSVITPDQAVFACLAGAILLPIAPIARRWLELLPLGTAAPLSLGVDLTRARIAILLLTALLTAAATLSVGPLGFVGLMAPHMARATGLQRPIPHLAGAAAIGALVMVAADWLGRTILFPYEVPAGVISTLIGGAYLFVQLRRRPA